MFKRTVKVEKRKPIRIEVSLISANESVKHQKEFSYDVPNGGDFKIHWNTNDLTIWNERNEIVTNVCWQAGFTKEFNMVYE